MLPTASTVAGEAVAFAFSGATRDKATRPRLHVFTLYFPPNDRISGDPMQVWPPLVPFAQHSVSGKLRDPHHEYIENHFQKPKRISYATRSECSFAQLCCSNVE